MTKGLSRRTVLSTGMAAFAAPALIGSRAFAAGETIKIGFVSPQTGPIAAFEIGRAHV